MFTHITTAIFSGSAVTLALLYLMQLLIVIQPGAESEARDRWEFEWLYDAPEENPPQGRDALAAKHGDGGPGRSLQLCTWTVDTEPGRAGFDVIGDEPIWHDDEVVGWVTSGGYAHHSEVSVAMGYVPVGLIGAGGTFEIEIVGDRRAATLVDGCLWDADGERMRG